jgi:hypothetical protein
VTVANGPWALLSTSCRSRCRCAVAGRRSGGSRYRPGSPWPVCTRSRRRRSAESKATCASQVNSWRAGSLAHRGSALSRIRLESSRTRYPSTSGASKTWRVSSPTSATSQPAASPCGTTAVANQAAAAMGPIAVAWPVLVVDRQGQRQSRQPMAYPTRSRVLPGMDRPTAAATEP